MYVSARLETFDGTKKTTPTPAGARGHDMDYVFNPIYRAIYGLNLPFSASKSNCFSLIGFVARTFLYALTAIVLASSFLYFYATSSYTSKDAYMITGNMILGFSTHLAILLQRKKLLEITEQLEGLRIKYLGFCNFSRIRHFQIGGESVIFGLLFIIVVLFSVSNTCDPTSLNLIYRAAFFDGNPEGNPLFVVAIVLFVATMWFLIACMVPYFFAIYFASISLVVRRIQLNFIERLSSSTYEKLTELLSMHNELTSCVKHIDDSLKFPVVITYGFILCQSFRNLYYIMFGDVTGLYRVYLCMEFLMGLIILILMMFPATKIPGDRYKVTRMAYLLSHKDGCDNRGMVELIMKIHGVSVRMTLMDMISITKTNFLKTLASLSTLVVVLGTFGSISPE